VIAQDIEQTRSEMDQTLEAIQDRIAPERITGQAVEAATEVTVQARDAAKEVVTYAIDEAKSAVRELAEQATGAVRDSTVGRVEHLAASGRYNAKGIQTDMLTMIRENPLPAAVAAIGIGWLLTSRSSPSHQTSNGRNYSYRGDGAWQSGMPEQVIGQAQTMGGQAQQMAGQAFGQAQDRAGRMQHQATFVMQDIAADPIALGVLGLVFGAVAGLILPETQKETELIGEARSQVAGRVQEAATQAVETAQRVATEVGQTAVKEVQGALEQAGSASGAAPA
jgi:hypothetical protein